MIKKILLGLVVIIAMFAAVVWLQPSDFRVSRSATIAAEPAVVFAQVNDFHNWQAWSPWAEKDPNAKNTFEGPTSGTGAIFAWDGNNEVGAGRMTIKDSKPNELVRIQLDFERPFKDTSTAEFTFQPTGSETQVTWSMFGKKNFVAKAFCMFMNMDKMVGGEFDKGLAEMKIKAEAAAKK